MTGFRPSVEGGGLKHPKHPSLSTPMYECQFQVLTLAATMVEQRLVFVVSNPSFRNSLTKIPGSAGIRNAILSKQYSFLFLFVL